MAKQLHEALAYLRPVEWADIPVDNLRDYLTNIYHQAELITNSVPPPPGSTDFLDSKRAFDTPNTARSAADMVACKVGPPPPSLEHQQLWDGWGKPVKIAAKDNPLSIPVYKMAGNDRHGAWFSRRSVHEGMGFEKWKRAMQQEFPESLAVKGGPGEGNVRGIGSDQRLESIDIDGVGRLEVYQLSAQFPGPVAPREFIVLLLTSSNGLTEASIPHVDSSAVAKSIPRHYMMVSVPITHPDAPPRQGLVRGEYESIEMVREIPLQSDSPEDNRELNPVEWVMITRSDPGGGIPRFMVERNVPSSITADAAKFLNWAASREDFEQDQPSEIDHLAVESGGEECSRKSFESLRPSIIERSASLAGVGTSIADNPPPSIRRASQRSHHSQGGFLSTITNSVEGYVPDALQPYIPGSFLSSKHDSFPSQDDDNDSTTDTSSLDSFTSATQFRTAEGEPLEEGENTTLTPDSSQQTVTDAAGNIRPIQRHETRYERELAKIESQRTRLEERLSRERGRQQKATEAQSAKDQSALDKAREKHSRDLKKQEEKFDREMRKLEQKREKEARKLAERRQKEADKNSLSKASRERDEFKKKVDMLQKENSLLKGQVGDLQKELTSLVAKVGRMDGGADVLKGVREEIASRKASFSTPSGTVTPAATTTSTTSQSSLATVLKASTESIKGGSSRERGTSIGSGASKESGKSGTLSFRSKEKSEG